MYSYLIYKEGCFLFDISVIYDAGVVGLRIIMPLLAIVIVYQCYAAMRRRRRPEKPLVSLYNPKSGGMIPVVFWENSIGRSKSSDIVINDLSVSRNHCVLLRRKAGWFVSDVGSLSGTFVNGVRIHGRAQVLVDDIIAIGNTEYQLRRGDDFNSPLRASRFFSKVSDKPAIQAWKLMFMITMFHLFMAVEAMFWNDGTNVYAPMILFAALAAVEWGFFSVSYFALRRVNFELEALGLFLTGIGVMMLVRQVERSAYVQLIAAAIGIVLYCVIIKFIEDPDRSDKIRFPVMIFAVLLLASSIVLGRVTNGAANWVYIGSISFQPSEFVKTIFIFIGASALDKLQTKRNLIEFIIFSVVCVGLLALMSDFGTALIFFVTFLLVVFMRSGDIKTVLLPVGSVVASFLLLRFVAERINFIGDRFNYVLNRFKAYRHVWDYANEAAGYQQVRVMTYIASGGLFGVGIGNGYFKQYFASESDLVFALVAEEMGVIVAIVAALAVALLMIYARAITTRSRSTFYSISACCAAGLLVVQLSLNIFGATDILPLTGVTFPFISSGGSSLISCWGLLAFLKAADERTYSLKR